MIPGPTIGGMRKLLRGFDAHRVGEFLTPIQMCGHRGLETAAQPACIGAGGQPQVKILQQAGNLDRLAVHPKRVGALSNAASVGALDGKPTPRATSLSFQSEYTVGITSSRTTLPHCAQIVCCNKG